MGLAITITNVIIFCMATDKYRVNTVRNDGCGKMVNTLDKSMYVMKNWYHGASNCAKFYFKVEVKIFRIS